MMVIGQTLGWEDVAEAYMAVGAQLTFRADPDAPDGEEPVREAVVTRDLADGSTATFGIVLTGDDVADPLRFASEAHGVLAYVDLWPKADEIGDAKKSVYREWAMVAARLIERTGRTDR